MVVEIYERPATAGPPSARRPRILTPYNKNNHPAWLEIVEVFSPLADHVARNWKKRLSLPRRIRNDLIWSWRLFRISKRYDVVLTGSDRVGLLLGILQYGLRRNRVPHIFLDFLINVSGGSLEKAARRIFYRRSLKGASCAIVQRACEVQAYCIALGLPASKFRFIPYHSTIFGAQIATGDNNYVFAGGDSDRDYCVLINAARELPYKVIIAALRRDHFAGLSIPQNVEIVTASPAGFLELLAHATVVVVPLKNLPQHIGGEQTYLNAMSIGKPVIVTDMDACDYIENGKTGVLTPAGDAARLARAITILMENAPLAQDIGAHAKESSVKFTPENFFNAVFLLCKEYVGARNPAPPSPATVTQPTPTPGCDQSWKGSSAA